MRVLVEEGGQRGGGGPWLPHEVTGRVRRTEWLQAYRPAGMRWSSEPVGSRSLGGAPARLDRCWRLRGGWSRVGGGGLVTRWRELPSLLGRRVQRGYQ